jgi:hypothetical protein
MSDNQQTKEAIMKIIPEHELRRLMMNNQRNIFYAAVMGYAKGFEEATGRDSPADLVSEIKLPRTVLNCYFVDEDGVGSVVGIDVQMIWGSAETMGPFKVDLAIATNVPGFWMIQEGVRVLPLVPAEGTKGDGIHHFAMADYAREIEAISMTAGPTPDNK